MTRTELFGLWMFFMWIVVIIEGIVGILAAARLLWFQAP
jgi:hypothetical protein